MPRFTTASAAGLILFAASLAGHAQTYVYRLTELDGGATTAIAINNSGQVTGLGFPPGECENLSRRFGEAFLWAGKEPTRFIDPIADCESFAGGADINFVGQVTGERTIGTRRQAFIWDGSTVQILGSLTGVAGSSRGESINSFGHVTGTSADTNGDSRAFLWDGVTMRDLGTLGGPSSRGSGINESGMITGSAALPSTNLTVFHAFLWDGTKMVDLGTLGGNESFGKAINASGQVVGRSAMTPDGNHAFLWEHGLMMDLGTLGGSFSDATAINNAGLVVGQTSLANTHACAFLWEKGTMKCIRSLVDPGDPLKPIVRLGQALDINNIGQIVATGINKDILQWRSYLISPRYAISGFLSPTVNSWQRGSTVRISVGLLDAANVRIPDARARLLTVDPCRVQVSATGAQTLNRSCMTYNATTNEFSFYWKLGSTGTGTSTIKVRVNYGAPGPLKAIKTKTITITN